MNTSPQIRFATPEDAAGLAAFGAQAFTDTYRDISEAQEIADYVAEHFQPEVMVAVIQDRDCAVLLAWLDDQLAGYAIVKNEAPPACVTGPAPLKLWRIYLGEGFIGRGLGAALMQAVHAEARRRGARTLWLGVYDRNVRAVAFYERFGFAKVGGQEFLFGGQIYIDPVYAVPVPGEV
ncbi:GNAT family N-acetyltransferase [Roseateles sp. NT4]|uniref:GNAT family N-acetyltransferase n=1 Tax=Roseateles sp. NT4 TaxID=3453715 RepID=UPI003EED42E7